MSKKQMVQVILEISSKIPLDQVPKTETGSIDMKKFEQTEVYRATITMLKLIGVNGKVLSNMGFIPAYMIYGRNL